MPEHVKRDGGTIHYEVFGPQKATAFVLIEGLGAHMIAWRSQFYEPLVDAGYRVVRFDNRDVGQSQRYPDGGYSISDMATDAHELIAHLELGAAHIVGQSMGGMVAQHLADEHPDDVASLCLIYTTATPSDVSPERGVEALGSAPRARTRDEAMDLHLASERICASPGYAWDEDWKRNLAGLMWDRGYDPDGVVRQREALMNDHMDSHALARLEVPVLVVHGTDDQLIPHHASRTLHERIPGSDLWLVDGLGHDLPLEILPELTGRVLANAHLARVDVTSERSNQMDPRSTNIPDAYPLGRFEEKRPLSARIAGAPISWGVCEVPGWGYQIEAGTVLREMRELGLAATEFGPDGFLADEPAAKAEQLTESGLQAVGGFLPVLLHDANHDPLPEVDRFIDNCLACGAGVVVLAAYTGVDGYDDRPPLDEAGWAVLLGNLDRISARAAGRGVVACLHPHVGTMIETAMETERVLAGSHVGLCVDTGHLLVGGADPVALTLAHPDRVVHAHLKDVDATMAVRVRDGELTYGEAVKSGMYRPLGQGDVDIASMVCALEGNGYQGWYVLEQDLMLDASPTDEGPLRDVRASRDYLLAVADNIAAHLHGARPSHLSTERPKPATFGATQEESA